MVAPKIMEKRDDLILDELEYAIGRYSDPAHMEYAVHYYQFHKRRFAYEMEIIQKYCREKEVIDIGAFPFQLSFFLKNAGFRVTSIDLKPERMERFLRETQQYTLKCDIEAERIPVPDNYASFVLFSEVFEHLGRNPFGALLEINRILKPGGTILLSTPNVYSLKNIYAILSRNKPFDRKVAMEQIEKIGHPGHVKEYSAVEVNKLLRRAGFAIKEVKYLDYGQSAQRGVASAIRSLLSAVIPFCRPYLVILAKK